MAKGNKSQELLKAVEGRREFLKTAGKFGITVPMAALLLSVNSKKSTAGTSYVKGNNGFGNGGNDGSPNGFSDLLR